MRNKTPFYWGDSLERGCQGQVVCAENYKYMFSSIFHELNVGIHKGVFLIRQSNMNGAFYLKFLLIVGLIYYCHLIKTNRFKGFIITYVI